MQNLGFIRPLKGAVKKKRVGCLLKPASKIQDTWEIKLWQLGAAVAVLLFIYYLLILYDRFFV